METLCKSCLYEKHNNIVVDRSRSVRDWARTIGASKSSIHRHWAHSPKTNKSEATLPGGYFWNLEESSFDGQSSPTSEQLSEDDVATFIRSKGLDPEQWDYTWRFSEWEQGSRDGGVQILHAIRVSGKRKAQQIDLQLNKSFITNFTYVPAKPKSDVGTFVLVPTDLQLGKVDWQGGTKETIDQVMTSFHKARDLCEKMQPTEICVIDAGDIIENIYNLTSQIATNDLSLPDQIVVAFDLMLAGLDILSTVGHIKYVSVPSNHGAHRTALQKPAGAPKDDWGIALAKLLDRATEFDVVIPEPYAESVVIETSGSMIGVAHSHQAGSADKISEWWARQTHGNMPTAQARILVAGHWHSFRVQQSGDEKWVFVGPASDRGSSWYSNIRGERATSGMLSFFTKDNEWSDLQIL